MFKNLEFSDKFFINNFNTKNLLFINFPFMKYFIFLIWLLLSYFFLKYLLNFDISDKVFEILL